MEGLGGQEALGARMDFTQALVGLPRASIPQQVLHKSLDARLAACFGATQHR